MGSPLCEPDRKVNEKPHRRVIPRSYAIMTKPVTVAGWQQFLKDRPRVPRDFLKRYSPEPGGPIIWASWYMAAQYCNWLSEKEGIPPEQWCYLETSKEEMKPYPDHLRRTGYRLATEAEWEYACRAGVDSDYAFGNDARMLGDHAWFAENSAKKTHPVGRKKPNPWGLLDMNGNVAEWCNDVYDPGFYKTGPEANPRGPAEGKEYVLRGGSWKSPADALRSAARLGENPGFSDACLARDAIGFRCVRRAPPSRDGG